MNETAPINKESSKPPQTADLLLKLPLVLLDRLKEEGHKRNVAISLIVAEALKDRYTAKGSKPLNLSGNRADQNRHIRRVVLDVLEELGLHKKQSRPGRSPVKPLTSHNKPKTEIKLMAPEAVFTENGDGTVTDNRSGLIWLKEANAFGRVDWDNAIQSAETLADGSHGLQDGSVAGDWRLPSREELRDLAYNHREHPELPDGHPFNSVQTGNYWSKEPHGEDPLRAWVVYINRNRINCTRKTGNYFAWPVRMAR